MVAQKMPNTVKSCMAGGHIHPFEAPPPRSIVELFYTRLVETGALNRAQIDLQHASTRSSAAFPWIIPMFRDLGLQIALALSYTISPRHTDEYYAQKTREIVAVQAGRDLPQGPGRPADRGSRCARCSRCMRAERERRAGGTAFALHDGARRRWSIWRR